MPLNFWNKALALLMHLIPTLIVLVALAVVLRREWVGAVLFPLLAVFYLVTKWGQLDWSGCAVIDGPSLLLGLSDRLTTGCSGRRFAPLLNLSVRPLRVSRLGLIAKNAVA